MLKRRDILSRLLLERAAAAAVIVLMTAPVILAQRQFYFGISVPVHFAFDLSRLDVIRQWTFRESPILWLTALAVSILILPIIWRRSKSAELSLMEWGLAIIAVCVVSTLLLAGNTSYTTRYYYLLSAGIGGGFALTMAVILDGAVGGPRFRRWVRQASVAMLAIAVPFAASLSYSKRLQVALPYYNNVTANELSGIQWLKGKKGTALVTAKGVGLNAGTQYSWLIEGLSRVRAYGTGEGYLSVLPVAVGETNDAERILSGNDIIETEVLRAAQRSDNRSQIDLFGLMDATWQPLISISPIWLDGSDPLSQVQRSQRRGESALLTWSSKSSLTGQMLAGSLQLASGHTSADFAASASSSARKFSVFVEPRLDDPMPVIAQRLGGATLEGVVAGRHVTITIEATDDFDNSKAVAMHRGAAGMYFDGVGDGLRLKFLMSGLDRGKPSLTTYHRTELEVKRDATYIYTWRSTGLVNEFSSRPCYETVFQNREVVIFAVGHGCSLS